MLRALLLLLLSGLTPALVQAAIETKTVEYRQGDTRLVGYLAYPKEAKAPLPGVLVVQGGPGTGKSLVAREAFSDLDAPPALHAPPDTPVPYAPELEDAYLPSAASTAEAIRDLLAF